MTMTLAILTALITADAGTAAADTAKADKLWVYVGTYTAPGKSKGIYRYELDLTSGTLSGGEVAAETANPSFLAVHPTRKFLYAAGEVGNFNGKKTGAVSAFALDAKTGQLTPLNQQSSGGPGPCHVTVDPSGKCVLVANYTGGSAAALPVEADGRLRPPSAVVQHTGTGADPRRQEGPHAHSINVDKGARFAMVADLGLDKVMVYRFDAEQGKLTPNDPPAAALPSGSGPRHFAFHPDGRHAYVINEMGNSVTAFDYDADRGVLTPVQTVPSLPEGLTVKGNTTAEVQVHPSGKFLYGSNRGHDTIAVFRIDAATGQLTPAGEQPTGGKTPRGFGIDPTGRYLIAGNQDSDTITVFRIDPATGGLTPTGSPVKVFKPVCVKYVPKTS
jgi:6-phosphogluconolactonase